MIFAVNLASYVLVTCGSVLVMVTSTLPAVVIEFTSIAVLLTERNC